MEIINKSLIKHQSYIDGEWLDILDGSNTTIFNPANQEEIGAVSGCGLKEINKAN